MLILKRRIGEKIKLGPKGEWTITVFGSKNRYVQLGFDVPDDILILREELYEARKAEGSLCGE